MRVVIKNSMQLAMAKENLGLLYKAWRKILEGQSYTIGDRQLTRANLGEISSEISDYEQAIDAYETHGTTKRRAARITPLG